MISPLPLKIGESPLRIVIDGRYISDRFPGIGRYTYNLVRALGRLDTRDDFFILINPRQKNRRFDLDLIAYQQNIHLVACHVPRSFPCEMFSLPFVIHKLRPSVYHSPFYLRPYAIACPCVTTLYDLIPLRHGKEAKRLFSRSIFWIGAKLACQSSAAIVTPSVSSGQSLQDFYKRLGNRLHIIPLAADPLFKPQPENAIRDMRLKLDLRGPYVLHVGSHFTHKNIESLIFAWAHLKSSILRHKSPHQLVLAGFNSSSYSRIKTLAMKSGIDDSVNFIGEIDEKELAPLYSGADLFVFPSKMEGFGLPVIEAMACGTPVLCSNTDTLKEITDGAARVIDPGHPDSFAEAIAQLLCSPPLRRTLSKKALCRSAQFTWEATAKATYRVYQKVSRG